MITLELIAWRILLHPFCSLFFFILVLLFRIFAPIFSYHRHRKKKQKQMNENEKRKERTNERTKRRKKNCRNMHNLYVIFIIWLKIMDRGAAFMSCNVILFLRSQPHFRMQIYVRATGIVLCHLQRTQMYAMVWKKWLREKKKRRRRRRCHTVCFRLIYSHCFYL